MEAATAAVQHSEEHPPPIIWSAKMPISKMGMFFFISSEVALFSAFFMSYFFLRVAGIADYSSWAHQIGTILPMSVVTINSLILFSSSVTVHFAEIALTRGARTWQAIWLALTFLLGATFLSIQIAEYQELINHEFLGPSTSAYSSVFFSITGLHGFHVFVGLVMLLVLLVRTLRGHYGPETDKHIGFTTMSIYWHFVDIIWIFVFSLIYIPGNIDRWGDTKVLGMPGYITFATGAAIVILLLNLPKMIGKGFAKGH